MLTGGVQSNGGTGFVVLKHWDEHYANEQEREIAARENIRAGWLELNNNDSSHFNSGAMALG